MKKYFLLLFLLPLMSFQAHKFYVSVTEIEYNQKNRSLQIISRVFIDDMEDLLKTRYSKELYLTIDEEHPEVNRYLKKYLDQKLSIEVNGKSYPIHFLGKKYDNDVLVLFIEIEEVTSPESIRVRNEVLTDLYPDQKNVVHVEIGEKTKSLLLSRDIGEGVLNFRK